MTLGFFKSLASLFGGRKNAAYRRDLLTWAKTEYANDWEFAYEHMLRHNGQAPKTHTRGIEL